MQDIQKFHKERFDARTTVVERYLIVGMWIAVVAALVVGFISLAPKPFYSEVGDVDAIPRSGCQMVCPRQTIAGLCPVSKIVWRPPYICVPSTY